VQTRVPLVSGHPEPMSLFGGITKPGTSLAEDIVGVDFAGN
jgi:hypothetical protein